jgi:serine/threonine protein kinase KIN1/2
VSAARRANERQDHEFWSASMTEASPIPEEAKEDTEDISSRNFAAREDQFSKPVHLKGLFSVATTSTKPLQKMRADLIRVLDEIGITHEEIKGGFYCVHRPSIALDSVQEPVPPTEEYSAAKKAKRRLSLGAPIAAAAQLAGFGSEKRVRHENESDISSESATDLAGSGGGRADVSGTGSSMVVQFEIYIVKFPLLALHGIQFKRVGGDVWQYKNACVKILTDLKW